LGKAYTYLSMQVPETTGLPLYVIDLFDDDEEKPIEMNPDGPATIKLSVSHADSFASIKSEIRRLKGYAVDSQRLLFLQQPASTSKRRVTPLCSFKDKQNLLEVGVEASPSFWLLKKLKRMPTQPIDVTGFGEENSEDDDEQNEGDAGEEEDLLC